MFSLIKTLLSIFIKSGCIFLAISASFYSYSYEPTRFTNITVEDGLVNNDVRSITQDSNGFMWLGTQSGLSRFDGYQFTNYQHILGDSLSLSDDGISAVVTDSKSIVWIGTLSGGLNQLNTITDSITHYTHQENNPDSIRSNQVHYLHLDNDNKLWIATNKGLDVLDLITQKIDHINLTLDTTSELFITDILSIDNNLWLATHFGIYIYNKVNHNIDTITYNPRDKNGLSSNKLYDLFQENKNKIWIATSNGLDQINPNTLEISHFDLLLNSSVNNSITSITSDSKNHLWVATKNEGIFQINSERTAYKQYYSNPYVDNTLNRNSVLKLFIDNNHVLWAISYPGLNKLSLRAESFGLQRHLPNQNKLKNKPILGLHEDSHGFLWVRQDELLRFIPTTGNYDKPYKSINNYDKKIFSNFIANASDNKNNIWLASNNFEIVYYDIMHNSIQYFSIKKFHDNGLLPSDNYKIRGLFYDKKLNLLWLNTNNALYQFHADEHKLISVTFLPDNMHHALHGHINEIYTDQKNYTWLGTYFGLFQLKNGKLINHYNNNSNTNNSISHDAILSLAGDNNTLWIGTQNGLNKYSYNTKSISLITTKDGLSDNYIHSMILDQGNNLWVSTNRGLSHINLSNHAITNFNKNDGLQAEVFGISSMLARRNGELVFGGEYGFNIFNPKDIEKATIHDIQISDIHLFNKKIPIAKLQKKNKELEISDQNTIVLDHAQNDLSINLSAVDYHDPMSIQYRYKLEGFNESWISRDAKNRTASFTNLNHGTYTLKAKATYDENNWPTEKTLLTIIVLPPWWQTIYAYIAYILLTITLIYTLIRLQTYRLKHKAIELENIVTQRTQQIQNQKSLIEEQAEHLQVLIKKKDQVFSHISHEFRTPLTLILGPLKHLFNVVNDTQQKSIELVQTNAYRLLRLVDQLLELSKLHAEQDAPTAKQKNISVKTESLMEAIFPSFVVLAENKMINLELTHHDHCQVACSYDSLEKIVTNLLSNAIKYTLEDGDIHLYITNKHNTHCEIIVKDNGLGIPEDQKDSIFEPFARVENDAKRDAIPGTGIGLSLVKELVETHEGTIQVESQLGIGSYFTVDIPLADAQSQITFQKNQHIDEVNLDIIDLTNRLQKELTPETESLVSDKNITLDEDRPVLLIIEDNPEMRQYIKSLCSPHYQCILAGNGKQGSQLAIEYIPDIILSDIMMPELDGHGCLRIIKADRRTCHIPVILLSALKDRENRIQGLQERADDVLTKPFDSEELLVRLENLLAIRDLVKQPRDTDPHHDDMGEEEPHQPKLSELDQLFLDHFDQMLDKYYVDEELDLETMAQHLLLSNRQMQRKLKALTGKNPNEYLRDFRLQKAIERLDKGYRVENVAYDVGFSSRSYFSKCFKSKYRTTPKHYQQQITTQTGTDSID